MHRMTDFDGEWFMILVRLLAARKNLVQGNRVAPCDATVRQTPHVFSDSPGISLECLPIREEEWNTLLTSLKN